MLKKFPLQWIFVENQAFLLIYRMQDYNTGYIKDTGYRLQIQDTGYMIRNLGYRVQNTRWCKKNDTEYRIKYTE